MSRGLGDVYKRQGDFLKDSAIIYYSSDVFLYNVNTNEFRKTIQYEEKFYKYKIEKPFSGGHPITDQIFLLGNMSLFTLVKLMYYPTLNTSVISLVLSFGFRKGWVIKIK